MSRIITLITVVGAALVVAVPAGWGQTQPDARSVGLNKMYGLGEFSPEVRAERLRSEGLNRMHGLGEYAPARAERLRSEGLNKMYGLGAYAGSSVGDPVRVEISTTAMLDAREKAFAAKRDVQLSSGTPPDAFERAVATRGSNVNDHFLASDDRFRIDPTAKPVPVSVTGSGDEIQWPEVGIGLAIGIALTLGLLLGLRATRHRTFAH
jgi:hypothetical protein